MTTTIIAIACLIALVITQGLVAGAIIHSTTKKSTRKIAIRTKV